MSFRFICLVIVAVQLNRVIVKSANEVDVEVFYEKDEEYSDALPKSHLLWEVENIGVFQCGLVCQNDIMCTAFFHAINVSEICYGYPFQLNGDVNGLKTEYRQGMKYFKMLTGCNDPGYMYDRTLDLCFKIHFDKKRKGKAHNTCVIEGGGLIVLNTKKRNTYITGIILDYIGNGFYWIGISDKATEGKWIWQDGRPLIQTYSGFKSPNPNDYDAVAESSNADCAYINKLGRWDDVLCSNLNRFICEKEVVK